MKTFIAFLLIFSSFTDGKDLGNDTTTNTTSLATSTTKIISTTTNITVAPSTSASTTETTLTTTNTTVAPSTTTTLSSTTTPVNTTVAPSPTADVGVNVTWTFSSGMSITNVAMVITNLQKSEWAAIGLGQTQSMNEAHVFICQRNADDSIVMNRYVNPGDYDPPSPAGSEQGGVFTRLRSEMTNGVITCQFSLSNFTIQTFKQVGDLRPLSQSGNYHPLFAIGPLDSSNALLQHNDDSHTALANTVQLSQNEIILYKVHNPSPNPGNSMKYFQAHGIIMAFAWIFFVSTGVLLSRYFKKSWVNTLVCGKPVWFAGHRFIMSIAVVLTILGFLFILVALGGTWPKPQDEKKHFIHTVTGALVISLAFFQPFIALFRCEPNSRYRFIFNYIHAFVGFSTLILSIATLFLATYFRLFKDNTARKLMIVWIIWIVFIFIVFEIIQNYYRSLSAISLYSNINSSSKTIEELVESPTSPTGTLNFDGDRQETTSEEKIKNTFLAVHVLVAAILAIWFSTLIV